MSFARWMVAFKIKLYEDIKYVQSDMKKIQGLNSRQVLITSKTS